MEGYERRKEGGPERPWLGTMLLESGGSGLKRSLKYAALVVVTAATLTGASLTDKPGARTEPEPVPSAVSSGTVRTTDAATTAEQRLILGMVPPDALRRATDPGGTAAWPEEYGNRVRETRTLIREAIRANGYRGERARTLDTFLTAVVKQESDFDAYAISSSGAAGLFQLMPATAQEHGIPLIYGNRWLQRDGNGSLMVGGRWAQQAYVGSLEAAVRGALQQDPAWSGFAVDDRFNPGMNVRGGVENFLSYVAIVRQYVNVSGNKGFETALRIADIAHNAGILYVQRALDGGARTPEQVLETMARDPLVNQAILDQARTHDELVTQYYRQSRDGRE